MILIEINRYPIITSCNQGIHIHLLFSYYRILLGKIILCKNLKAHLFDPKLKTANITLPELLIPSRLMQGESLILRSSDAQQDVENYSHKPESPHQARMYSSDSSELLHRHTIAGHSARNHYHS